MHGWGQESPVQLRPPSLQDLSVSSHEDRPVVITESDRIRRPLYHEPAAERRLGADWAATISTNAPAMGPGDRRSRNRLVSGIRTGVG
jgi:hypothetical protein